MTMNQQEPPVAGSGRGVGAAELEAIARVFLTTHGDRVQRWTLHDQGSIRKLVLHSWHPDVGYVMVQVGNEGIILIWSEGDDGYRELDATDDDVLTEIGLELSAHIAGGFSWFYSWAGTPIERRREDSLPRRLDRLLRRSSRALPLGRASGSVPTSRPFVSLSRRALRALR